MVGGHSFLGPRACYPPSGDKTTVLCSTGAPLSWTKAYGMINQTASKSYRDHRLITPSYAATLSGSLWVICFTLREPQTGSFSSTLLEIKTLKPWPDLTQFRRARLAAILLIYLILLGWRWPWSLASESQVLGLRACCLFGAPDRAQDFLSVKKSLCQLSCMSSSLGMLPPTLGSYCLRLMHVRPYFTPASSWELWPTLTFLLPHQT